MKRSAQLLLASCVGCLTGAGIAAVVDGALVEISTNGFFTLLYGVCLLVIGFVLLWRVFSIKAAVCCTALVKCFLNHFARQAEYHQGYPNHFLLFLLLWFDL